MFSMFGRAKTEAPSLLRGLASDLLLLHLIGFAVLAMVVFDRLDQAINDLAAETMQRNALDLAERFESHGFAAGLDSSLHARFSSDYGRYRFSVLDRDGAVLTTSMQPPQPLAGFDPGEAGMVRFRVRHRAAMLWGVTVPTRIGATPVWIQVAEDMNHRDAVIDEIAARFLDSGGWLILGLSAAQIALILSRMRRRIHPIIAASASATEIGPEIGHQMMVWTTATIRHRNAARVDASNNLSDGGTSTWPQC